MATAQGEAYLCDHVFRGERPVLMVTRRGGKWQFLCGATHAADEVPRVVHLDEVWPRDPSLSAVRDLCAEWEAERPRPGADWQRTDLREARIREDIARQGFHVLLIRGDAGTPNFGFTIGLWVTCRHPEIMVFGMTLEDTGGMLHHVGAMVKQGRRFANGAKVDKDILTRASVYFVKVDEDEIDKNCGYARWYYGPTSFEVMQCVWPDRGHRYPWQPDADPQFLRVQPLLGPPPTES